MLTARQTDRHDEANSHFRNFANAPKNANEYPQIINNFNLTCVAEKKTCNSPRRSCTLCVTSGFRR